MAVILKPHNIYIEAEKHEGKLRCNIGELAEHANWYERWAIAFVYRLIDRVFQASYLLAEKAGKNKIN